jgi:hypothetical protein
MSIGRGEHDQRVVTVLDHAVNVRKHHVGAVAE